MRRLRKLAYIEELNEMNMPLDVINQVLYANNGEDILAEQLVYRRLMNPNTMYVVEMWIMSDNTYGVFSGQFDGMWTVNNVVYNGNFSNEAEAETYIQTYLQNQADVAEVVMVESRLRRNDFLRKHAAGEEPDYKKMAEEFAKQINLPEIERRHKTSLNRFYDDWVAYMKQYYPEWAKYPAFIWRGWGYFVDNYNIEETEENVEEEIKENNQQDVKEEQEVDIVINDTSETNIINDMIDMGIGDDGN